MGRFAKFPGLVFPVEDILDVNKVVRDLFEIRLLVEWIQQNSRCTCGERESRTELFKMRDVGTGFRHNDFTTL